ncbi:MAG: hypothetical protein LBM19_01390 [Holosporales bacterium]|jgi:hypothetical protein|nr:hypothetical protein [Holosporales bacterium]
MSFFKKLSGFIIVVATLVVLQIYSKDIGRFELHILGKDFSIGIYFAMAVVFSILSLCFFIKSLLKRISLLFTRNKKTEEENSIRQIAELIMANDYDFAGLFKRNTVISKFTPIKTALSLRRNLAVGKNISKTKIPSVDICIVKLRLKELLDQNELNAAVELADKAIKKYPKYLSTIQDEILEIAQSAKKNGILFFFDPRKFKYGFPQRFIDGYFISLSMVDFNMEPTLEKKLRIIEKLHKDYPSSVLVLRTFLDFVGSHDSIKYNEKKIISAIKETTSVNPNRTAARYLLKLNRKDGFEIAQELTASISDDNIEKLWLLLIIATKMNFVAKAKELIKKIVETDSSNDIFKFYMQNHEILSADGEILKTILGKTESNRSAE